MAPPTELELSDPTDWTPTSLPSLSPLDSALRCQVCKDFYNNAVITSCTHSFCSLCIRRCLAADGQCPACRAKEQEVKLRRNVALQEVVDAFIGARAKVLVLAREDAQQDKSLREQSRGQKRKRAHEQIAESSQRQTRRSTRHGGHASYTPSSTQDGAADEPITIDDGEDDHTDGEYNPEPEDGLVPCPMCGKRMKEEQVFTHLDRCESEKTEEANRLRDKPSVAPVQSQKRPEDPPPERLPALNYALSNDTKLKQKLKALGISNAGSRPLLIRRHTEWINLWNANCDSPRPVSRRELMLELDKWERSQGGLSQNGGLDNSTIMKKDFDGQAWASKNKTDFDSLIKQAKAMRAKATVAKVPDVHETQPLSNGDGPKPQLAAGVDVPAENDEDKFSGEAKASNVSTTETVNLARAKAITPPMSTIEQDDRSQDLTPFSRLQCEAHIQTLEDEQAGLLGHFGLSDESKRQVPMFEVPQEPVKDTELGEHDGK